MGHWPGEFFAFLTRQLFHALPPADEELQVYVQPDNDTNATDDWNPVVTSTLQGYADKLADALQKGDFQSACGRAGFSNSGHPHSDKPTTLVAVWLTTCGVKSAASIDVINVPLLQQHAHSSHIIFESG